MDRTDEDRAEQVALVDVALSVCALCLAGAGGECHVPGCAFWMVAAPNRQLIEVLKEAIPAPAPTYFVSPEFRRWDPDQ